ncbi:MAG: DUF4271 domain-containing protein [Muribaculaceae bacterium]|nr:DUF4271 domain-containing protein [Muribaculaceae bacterium]
MIQNASDIHTQPVMEVPDGTPAASHTVTPLHDNGAMALLLLSLVLVATSYKTGYKYIQNFSRNLFSIKRRESIFIDHTVSEVKMMSALAINTCVMMGVAFYYTIAWAEPTLAPTLQNNVFLCVGALSLIVLAFYFVQLLGLKLLGYVFSDKINTKVWLNGYKASWALLGLLLLPVVIAMLLFPHLSRVLTIIVVILYLCCRFIFIYKGFRIFFNNLTSSVYFILYLCSVEIVPPILLSAGAVTFCYFI